MNTIKLIGIFFTEFFVEFDKKKKLESKKRLKSAARELFKEALEGGINPLMAFQVLYHRLNQVSQVAKDVFYEPAVKYAQKNDIKEFLGTKVSIRTKEEYIVIPSPKIQTLKSEIKSLDNKNKSVVKAYESYCTDKKSLEKQIKEEENRLIEKGMAKKKGEKNTLSLKY